MRATLHCIGALAATCPGMDDLAVWKVAGRDKDAEVVRMMLKENMIEIETSCERIPALDNARLPAASLVARACRRHCEAVA